MSHKTGAAFIHRVRKPVVLEPSTKKEAVLRSSSSLSRMVVAAGISLAAGDAFANELIDGGAVETVTSGMTFDAAGSLIVGGNSFGQLNISSGGQAINTDAYIGFNSGSQGQVFVSGAGATWTTTGVLSIGFDGQAIVQLDDGASIIAVSGTALAEGTTSFAQLTLSGTAGSRALFSTPWILRGLGSGLLQWDGGVFQARGNETEFFANFVFGDIDIQANGAFFDTNGFDVGMQTPGILIGSGGFTKLGAGTLSIAGDNSWDGDTTVTAGTLTLDSYLQSGSQILTIGVANSATYGRLNVSGAATFNNSNLAVDVIGSPTLANNLILTDVITAGALTSSGFVVSDNSALFDFTAAVDGNSVDLNVSASGGGVPGAPGAPGTPGTPGSPAITVYSSALSNRLYPALGAAAVLDTQVQGAPVGDMADVVTALGRLPDERGVARAAAQTLPLNGGADATLGALGTINALFASRLAADEAGTSSDTMEPESYSWFRPLGSRINQNDTDRNASGYSAGTWGLAAGVEGELGDTQIGFGYAYAETDLSGRSDLSGAGTSAEIDSHLMVAYGSQPLHDMALGFQIDIGRNAVESDRSLNFGGLSRTASASYTSWNLHAGLNLSTAITVGQDTVFIPTLRADYTRLSTEAYTETGAGALSLNVDASTVQTMIFGVDGRLVHALSPNAELEATVGISYDAIDDGGHLTAAYTGVSGRSFVAEGIDRGAWLVKAGFGYSYDVSDSMDLSVRYEAGWRDDYLAQSVSLKAAWRF